MSARCRHSGGANGCMSARCRLGGGAVVGGKRVGSVTGDASVEWKVAEMGSFRPTVVPVVA